jgi:uncharacterized protein DUF4350
VRRSATILSVVVFFGLVIVGLWRGDDYRDHSATSFGKIPSGYGALYDFLSELKLAVARSYAPPAELPVHATVWWIEPDRPCEETRVHDEPSTGRDRGMPEPALDGPGLHRWIAAGGTAVVFLPPDSQVCSRDARLAGAALPPREEVAVDPAISAGKDEANPPAPEAQISVEGKLVSHPRILDLPTPFCFQDATQHAPGSGAEPRWEAAARVGGRPFVLWQGLGQGQLVVVADARFVRNSGLDRADAALLVADLVRAYGVPWIDERAHGLFISRSALAYLVASSAAPFLAGAAILALAFVWFRAATPPRRVPELDPSAPSLDAFVDSLAACYASTRDYARVFERFRELTSRRLRRHFGLPPDAPESQLLERLRRRSTLSPEALDLLANGTPLRSSNELATAVRQIDRLVREAIG